LLAGVKCEDVDDDQQKDMVSKIHSLQSELAIKEMDGLFLRIGRAVLKGLECLAGAGEVGICDSDLDLSWEDYKCVFEDRESFIKRYRLLCLC